jgi:putative endonuclease
MSFQRSRGPDAENRARAYLEKQGLHLLKHNYRSRLGEIDLIMQDRDSLVFVEVRYRHRQDFGSGAESVDRRKQSKLIACAQYYIQTHPKTADQPCRFDVVSIGSQGDDGPVQWIQNAFLADW